MQYFSEKVVAINDKLFTTTELIRPVIVGGDNILILREVERKTIEYNHPVKGKVSVSKFIRVNQTPKYSMRELEWEVLNDTNIQNTQVDVQN